MTELAVRADAGLDPRGRYESLRAAGLAALDAGGLAEALEHFAAALAVAREHLDQEMVDRALCNRAAVAISLGQVEQPVPDLREILMRNLCAENCALAAYNIARAYELRKEHKKSLFYARIARDRAEQAAKPNLAASAANQIGSALLADSFFDEAAASYRNALAVAPAGDSDRQLVFSANLGYCEVVRQRHRQGLRLLYQVLRRARAERRRRPEVLATIDLCFAHLEGGALDRARRHGERGLRLAEEIGEVDWIKNALYLLGEVAVLQGRADDARHIFVDLQQRFYPSQPYLPDFLVGVDVRSMINLRA